jgi:phage baseplate assembly protein W
MHIDHPLHVDSTGRTALTGEDDYVRDLIEQVLFTAPGERVNRPTFGSGLLSLVFAPNSAELVATSQMLVQAALQEWLGDLIRVDAVSVQSPAEATIQVDVAYTVIRDQTRGAVQFLRQV